MEKTTGQFEAEYFDEDFFWSDMSSPPPKGGTRGCRSPHDVHWVNAILEIFGNKGYSFIDVGCGMGWVVEILRERGEEAHGVDISEYAIQNSPVREYVSQGDVVTLKTDVQYDIVICNRVLCYLNGEKEALSALRNLKRMAKKYVVAAISCSDHIGPGNAERALKSRKRLWTKSQWQKRFEKAGLEVDWDLTDRIVKPRLHWDCIWVMKRKVTQ